VGGESGSEVVVLVVGGGVVMALSQDVLGVLATMAGWFHEMTRMLVEGRFASERAVLNAW